MARLEEMNIPVLVLSPGSIKEVCRSIELLGVASGEEERARQLVAEISGRIAAVGDRVSQVAEEERVRVYYEVYADPLMSIGKTTVIHEIIEAAGGKNIFGDVDVSYPRISAEAVIDRNPQVIVFPNYHGTEGFLANEIMSRPGWSTVDAVTEGRIYGIDPDIVSRPGPRIAEAVEKLAALFYPGPNREEK